MGALAALLGAAALAPVASASAPPPVPVSPAPIEIRDAHIGPRHAYFAGRPLRITFRVASQAPLALTLAVVRERTNVPVLSFALPVAAPGSERQVTWDGRTGRGDVAPNGAYRVRAVAPDGTARKVVTFTLHSHIYPIRGPHHDRGPIGAFGAPRSGGRTHEGFDVMASCGTPLDAARGGRVVYSGYDPVLYGNRVIIRGEATKRDYWYAHLQQPSPLHKGDSVLTGQRIGRVGETGNARTVGCHLHFEIHARGVPIDPAPELHAWDAWS